VGACNSDPKKIARAAGRASAIRTTFGYAAATEPSANDAFSAPRKVASTTVMPSVGRREVRAGER